MKPIETEFKYQGRNLRQIERIGRVCIYELSGRGGVLYGFEVVILKIAPAEKIMGVDYPERELYPSSAKNSSDWGSIAWSYPVNQLPKAKERFNGLVKEEQEHGFKPGGGSEVIDLMVET